VRSGVRRGFALLTVLWVLALAGSAAMAAAVDGRVAVDAARRRVAAMRGGWEARGCAAVIRARMAAALEESSDERQQRFAWRRFGGPASGELAPRSARCRVTATPLGERIDVNALSREQLAEVIARAEPGADASALARDILAARGRQPADAFASREELEAVPALRQWASLHAILDIEPLPVALLHVSPRVLAALPGMSAEAVAHVLARRQRAPVVEDLHMLVASAPPTVRESMALAFQSLSLLAVVEPAAWRLEVAVDEPSTGHVVRITQVLRRNGARVLVAREITW
jgi:hypothetical protein